MTRLPPRRWKEVQRILRNYDVRIDRCTNGFKLKRMVAGRMRIMVLHGHGKDFEVKVPYLNQIVDKLDIPESEFYS
jgi:hypothetical protein